MKKKRDSSKRINIIYIVSVSCLITFVELCWIQITWILPLMPSILFGGGFYTRELSLIRHQCCSVPATGWMAQLPAVCDRSEPRSPILRPLFWLSVVIRAPVLTSGLCQGRAGGVHQLSRYLRSALSLSPSEHQWSINRSSTSALQLNFLWFENSNLQLFVCFSARF